MPRFGEKLHALREHYGLSYRQLGAELGYDHTTFSKIESGARMPSYELIIKIAHYFEVSFDELLDDARELRLKKR
jgi:transcriptional regulator with XRE-family HTH domain